MQGWERKGRKQGKKTYAIQMEVCQRDTGAKQKNLSKNMQKVVLDFKPECKINIPESIQI